MAQSSRKGKKKAVSYAEVDSDVDMEEEDRQVEQIKALLVRKKARRTTQASTVDSSVTPPPSRNLPLDILEEICTHVTPADLISISSCSKDIRNFLLSPSTSRIWKASRLRIGLPTFEHVKMSEITHARMAFSWTRCQKCGEEDAMADTELRTRMCHACYSALCINANSFKEVQDDYHRLVISCVPKLSVSRLNSDLYFLADLEQMSSKLCELDEADAAAAHLSLDEWQRSGAGQVPSFGNEGIDVSLTRTQAFVAQTKDQLDKESRERVKMVNALSAYKAREMVKAIYAETDRVNREHMELLQIGWREQDFTLWRIKQWKYPAVPLKTPLEDPKAWNALKRKLLNSTS